MADQDDFEMRPITPGLGFHKRPVSLKEHVAKTSLGLDLVTKKTPLRAPEELITAPATRSHGELLNDIHSALQPIKDKAQSSVRVTQTLPRTDAGIQPEIRRQPSIDPISDINFQIPNKSIQTENNLGVRRGGHDGLVDELSPIAFSAAAAILDGVIVLAISLLFLVALVSVTGIDFASVMTVTSTDYAAQLSLLVMYFALAQMYLLATRTFAGSSLGEWTFDMQVGESSQFLSAGYPLRVLARSIAIIATGLFLLPLVSLFLGRDLAGELSGIRLYRKNI